jgi:hypothetical protein
MLQILRTALRVVDAGHVHIGSRSVHSKYAASSLLSEVIDEAPKTREIKVVLV